MQYFQYLNRFYERPKCAQFFFKEMRSIFFMVPENSVKKMFCLNFYPNVALGVCEFMHQFSCFTLCFYWMHNFFFVISKVLKSGKFIKQFERGQTTKRLRQEKYLATIHRYEAKAKISSQTYLFQKQAKIILALLCLFSN